MFRKRKAHEAFDTTQANLTGVSLFKLSSLGLAKPSIILRALKTRVRHYLQDDIKDFANAVLVCEEIYNLTRPKLNIVPLDLHSVSPQTKETVENEFTRLIESYTPDEPTGLDYIEYSGLANDIVHALLLKKKYSAIQKLLDEHSLLTVAQVSTYITKCGAETSMQMNTPEAKELSELRKLFLNRCNVQFNSKNPSISAYAYYYLYVLCEKHLYSEDSLKLTKKTSDPQALAYLNLVHFLEIYTELQYELSWAYVHDDSSESNVDEEDLIASEEDFVTTEETEQVLSIKQKITSTSTPLLADSIFLNHPTGLLQLVDCLPLDNENMAFWSKVGILQGNLFKTNYCLANLVKSVLNIIISQQRGRNSLFTNREINKMELFTTLNKQALIVELQKMNCDKKLIQCLVALQALHKKSEAQVIHLIAQMNPRLLPRPGVGHI